MRCYNRMFMLFLSWNKLVKKSEEFFNLLFWEIGVVSSVLNFKSVNVCTLSGDNVWQGVEAWVADGHAHGVVVVSLK